MVYCSCMEIKRQRGAPAASSPPSERAAQKRRTRKAIVEATIALLARGETPSVNDVAAEADVSRRTVYLYFPTFDQLLIDATLGALSQAPVDRAIEETSGGDNDEDGRLERVVRALQHVTPEMERLGRRLIRLTADPEAPRPGEGLPRRGYRRIEWLEKALLPFRDRIDRRRWQRLVYALAMVAGWEALIVQRDVCSLSPSEGEELSVWAAHTLLRATLEEARNPRVTKRQRHA